MRGVMSLVSHKIGILRRMNSALTDTSVLLRYYYAFVLIILEYCSPVCGSAANCYLNFLEHQVCALIGVV